MRIPDDCTVRLIDLPYRVGGTVALSPDGHYNIYINARSGDARRRASLDHELRHIENGDFFNTDDIRTVEARASRRTVRLSAIPQLMRARDLLPKPAAEPARPAVSPYQARVIRECLSELDRFLFDDPFRGAL